MSALADFRRWVRLALSDSGSLVWSDDEIDQGLRQALSEYSAALPFSQETVLELPGDGWEVALDGLDGLQRVLDCHYPYDSTLSGAAQLANQTHSWRLWWDDARPVLELRTAGGRLPQAEEELRVWYSTPHTIQDLDGAEASSVRAGHEQLLVSGAVGYAALQRVINNLEVAGQDMFAVVLMGSWARGKQREFQAGLLRSSALEARSGPAAAAWQMDS
jgi:hypothetical protein